MAEPVRWMVQIQKQHRGPSAYRTTKQRKTRRQRYIGGSTSNKGIGLELLKDLIPYSRSLGGVWFQEGTVVYPYSSDETGKSHEVRLSEPLKEVLREPKQLNEK